MAIHPGGIMETGYNVKKILSVGLVLILMCFFTGCLGLWGDDPAPSEGSGTVAKSRETTAVYYDFEDVLIPKELKIVDKQTVVVRSPGFVSGIIALKGRVDRSSLFNFFNNNMQKDNWNIISQIKSPGTSILVFQKASKTSVITIRDEEIYTWVEIGVAPTVTAAEPMMESFSDDDGLTESTISE